MVAAAATTMTGLTATTAYAAPSGSNVVKQIDAASNKLEDITESYNALNIELQRTRAQERKLADSLAPAKAALAAARSRVDAIAATSYEHGRVGPMSALLTAGDHDNLIAGMAYLEQINAANQRAITVYTGTMATYEQHQAALRTSEARQNAQLGAIDATRKKIETDLQQLRAMRVAAFGSASEQATPDAAGPPPAISGSAGKAVDYAYEQANKPAYYKFGAAGPNLFDCSGLIMAAWRAAGKDLPHNAAAQRSATAPVTRAELKPGDLVFYRDLEHVGLYVGDNMIIDAGREGEPIQKRTINIMPPIGYGRVR